MSDAVNELIFEHSKGQAQFAYFQLGVAASAVAFAIHETNGKSLEDIPWLTGAAVFFWALSFALGCFGLGARLRAINSNVHFLRATKGAPTNPVNPKLKSALEQATAGAEKEIKRPGMRFRLQMWALFLGALAFIGGHVQQMARIPSSRAIPAAVSAEQR